MGQQNTTAEEHKMDLQCHIISIQVLMGAQNGERSRGSKHRLPCSRIINLSEVDQVATILGF